MQKVQIKIDILKSQSDTFHNLKSFDFDYYIEPTKGTISRFDTSAKLLISRTLKGGLREFVDVVVEYLSLAQSHD